MQKWFFEALLPLANFVRICWMSINSNHPQGWELVLWYKFKITGKSLGKLGLRGTSVANKAREVFLSLCTCIGIFVVATQRAARRLHWPNLRELFFLPRSSQRALIEHVASATVSGYCVPESFVLDILSLINIKFVLHEHVCKRRFDASKVPSQI